MFEIRERLHKDLLQMHPEWVEEVNEYPNIFLESLDLVATSCYNGLYDYESALFRLDNAKQCWGVFF
jgi:hypothetical protein